VDSPASQRFNARLSEFESIAAFIEGACASLQEDARLRIVLLVEELFVNSVNHGYGGDSDQPVWLTLSVGDDECRLVYEDCAPAYDPFAAVDTSTIDADLDQRRIGGLGIVLLVEFSSKHDYQRRGDRNVIELEVPHDRRQ
jgi:anti-sigma regulatory factor (Ser/Thr protein kinase)